MFALPPHRSKPAIRVASSILVLRPKAVSSQNANNFEVLFIRRSNKSSFFAKAYAFPGGVLENNADKEHHWHAHLKGSLPARAPFLSPIVTKRTGEGLHHRICALRELFEETGLLLSSDSVTHTFADAKSHDNWRTMVHDDATKFHDLCQQQKIVPDVFRMLPFSRWITPHAEKKRYDTWFYLYLLPPGEEAFAKADDAEVTNASWFAPTTALQMARRGEIELPPPTTYILTQLQQLGPLNVVQNVVTERNKLTLETFLPTIYVKNVEGSDSKQIVITLPGDEAHDAKAQTNALSLLNTYPAQTSHIDPAMERGTLHRVVSVVEMPKLKQGSIHGRKGWDIVDTRMNAKSALKAKL